MTAIEFHENVLTLATRFDFSTTSGLRSVKRNRSVGGNANSRHLQFCAIDCVLDEDAEKSAFIREAKRLGLKAIDEGDHIHLQTP